MKGNDRKLWLLPLWLLFTVTAVGCIEQPLFDEYGKRTTTTLQPQSVAGTKVLALMFEQAGHQVSTREVLSPRLNNFQTLIWFPDDIVPPSLAERAFLENWLRERAGRTVIYVGRDFDAASHYWRVIRAQQSNVDVRTVDRRLSQSIARHDRLRGGLVPEEYVTWFNLRSDQPVYRAQNLQGPWAEGVDGAATEIDLLTRFDVPTPEAIARHKAKPTVRPATTVWKSGAFQPAPRRRRAATGPGNSGVAAGSMPPASVMDVIGDSRFDVLLATDRGDPLVTRCGGLPNFASASSTAPESQLMVVTNGSFLVNIGLVNHEHRKLAARLIEQCGPAGSVAFLESSPGGIEIREMESEQPKANGFELFQVFPLNVILLHLIAAGIVVCFVKLPIFGRPKKILPESTTDFRQHLVAAGELLSWSQDSEFACEKIEIYRQKVPAKNQLKAPPKDST
ncbi:MAG: hypothetical protein ACKPEY_09555 [Planctomycetota bacterium]